VLDELVSQTIDLPSIVAARAGADVLATDASSDALALVARNARERCASGDGIG